MQQDDLAIVITQILGRVSSDDAHVFCTGSSLGNASRWVFDVHQTRRAPAFSCRLLTWSGRRDVVAPVMSFYLGPLSESFWDAGVFLEPGPDNIRLVAARITVPIQYRVAIDLVHSASR